MRSLPATCLLPIGIFATLVLSRGAEALRAIPTDSATLSPGNPATSLPPKEAQQRIAELRSELARHDALYFGKAEPEISDATYDGLKREVQDIEAAFPGIDPPSSPHPAPYSLGDDRTGKFQTYQHRERMLGLDKAFSEADARRFHARLSKQLRHEALEFVIEPKVDGLAVSVTYERGHLGAGCHARQRHPRR